MKSVDSSLEKIGLDSAEASVYRALLQANGGTVAHVAELADIERTLKKLVARGLAGTYPKGRRVEYIPEPPTRLLALHDEQRVRIAGIMPTLLHVAGQNSHKPKITLHEGIAGVWSTYDDILKHPNSEVLSFVPTSEHADELGASEVKKYIATRVQKNISVRAIFPHATPDTLAGYISRDRSSHRVSRVADTKLPFSIGIDIYGNNKIALASGVDGIGVIIESQHIHDSLRAIFEICWNASRPIKTK
jgi:sugar-specific transcriptional regulator TrmB